MLLEAVGMPTLEYDSHRKTTVKNNSQIISQTYQRIAYEAIRTRRLPSGHRGNEDAVRRTTAVSAIGLRLCQRAQEVVALYTLWAGSSCVLRTAYCVLKISSFFAAV